MDLEERLEQTNSKILQLIEKAKFLQISRRDEIEVLKYKRDSAAPFNFDIFQ